MAEFLGRVGYSYGWVLVAAIGLAWLAWVLLSPKWRGSENAKPHAAFAQCCMPLARWPSCEWGQHGGLAPQFIRLEADGNVLIWDRLQGRFRLESKPFIMIGSVRDNALILKMEVAANDRLVDVVLDHDGQLIRKRLHQVMLDLLIAGAFPCGLPSAYIRVMAVDGGDGRSVNQQEQLLSVILLGPMGEMLAYRILSARGWPDSLGELDFQCEQTEGEQCIDSLKRGFAVRSVHGLWRPMSPTGETLLDGFVVLGDRPGSLYHVGRP